MENMNLEPKHYLLRRVAGSSYIESSVRCPFYRRDDGRRRIACEGIVDDSSITLTYRFKHLFDRQMTVFCCDRFQNCEVYRMLMEKYE